MIRKLKHLKRKRLQRAKTMPLIKMATRLMLSCNKSIPLRNFSVSAKFH